MPYLNLAFYRFTHLEDPEHWARTLKMELEPLGVKGTLILAEEGINGFLAGEEEAARNAAALLGRHPPFQGLSFKESFSESIPFEKFAIKRKPEIVTFRQEVAPTAAPRLTPEELDRWYREEDFLLLDTRNAYEAKVGAFRNATLLPIDHFVDFPSALASLPSAWKQKKVVTYCTGGIRCEKAAPYLRHLGFDAYQLDGGILNYLEKSGRNWEGECFVFDQRVAVGKDLKPTGARLCGSCQGPVPVSHPHCPHCGN